MKKLQLEFIIIIALKLLGGLFGLIIIYMLLNNFGKENYGFYVYFMSIIGVASIPSKNAMQIYVNYRLTPIFNSNRIAVFKILYKSILLKIILYGSTLFAPVF
ncbi:MAG: hypothetical protein P8O83_01445, partial [Flavobacteriaceae bacterium]|nr:hypothetical protein [Flavobacteriaceae bacterium]